jgi:mannose-6-phosphate isomerase-like protein (cupin superfamily)
MMDFEVLQTQEKLQTATMTLAPGEASGPKSNEHPESEQVLYLAAGELRAEIGKRTFTMQPGDSAIVPRNVPHRFENCGSTPAVTFNVYAPPAY